MRIGFGYDSHRLEKDRRLILGGVEIPHDTGLQGHSDADALLHAICDAIIGAIGEGDIGRHFPDTDPAYKDISSLELMRRTKELADKKNYRIVNVDSTIVLEKPKLSGHVQDMIFNVSQALAVPLNCINIKAKTNEGMDAVGRREGIAVFAVCLVEEAE